MKAIIKTKQGNVIVKNGKVTAPTKPMSGALNALYEAFLSDVVYSPYPDLDFADYLAKKTGGKVIHKDTPPPLKEGVVY